MRYQTFPTSHTGWEGLDKEFKIIVLIESIDRSLWLHMHTHVFLHLHVFECDAWQHMQEIKVQ